MELYRRLLITRSAVRARPGEPQKQRHTDRDRPNSGNLPRIHAGFPNIQYSLRAVLGAVALLLASLAAHADLTFIAMGQSNMTRQGAEQVPFENIERVQVRVESGWAGAANVIATRGLGPAVPFAAAMVGATGQDVRIIPCAVPSTRIGLHVPAWQRTTIYGDCLARVGDTPVDGIVWWQGEDDALREAWAVGWAATFQEIVAAWRRDLNQPRLPVVVVRLRKRPDESRLSFEIPGWDRVRAAQMALVGPALAVVSSDGLAYPDEIHADGAGYVTMGGRLAYSMAALLRGQTP